MTADDLIALASKKKIPELVAAVKADPKLLTAKSTNWYGTTAFHHACCYVNRAAALALLELGADPNRPAPCSTEEPHTPLEYVCSGRSSETQANVDDRVAIARALFAAGARVTPSLLLNACDLGAGKSRELVALLLEHRAPLAEPGLLTTAVEYDHAAVVEALLADPSPELVNEGVGSFGGTPLHVAVKKRAVRYIELLVAAGARADLENSRGQTPRSIAPKNLLPLLEGGPAPEKKKAPKKTALSDELFASVWEAPEDRSRLQVLADAFLEQGQVPRGTYMQLSLLPKRTPAQEKLRAQLLKKHRGEWLGEARPLVKKWVDSETEPGFVAHATVSPERFLEGFELVCKLGPRLVVEWTKVSTRAQLKALAALPLGRRLYGLDLHNPEAYGNDTWVDDIGLEILSPALAGLRSLSLTRLHDRFSDAMFESVARSAGPTLQSLTLASKYFDEGWGELTPPLATLTPEAFPALERLEVLGAGKPVQRRLRKQWRGKVSFG